MQAPSLGGGGEPSSHCRQEESETLPTRISGGEGRMPDGPTGCSRILGHASCGNWSGGFWAAGRSEIPGAGCSGKKRRPAPVTGEITRGREQSRARVAPPPHRAPRGEPANEASSALAPRTGNRKSFPSGAVLGATLQVRSSRCTGSQCRRRGSASGTPARAPEYAVRQGVRWVFAKGREPGEGALH